MIIMTTFKFVKVVVVRNVIPMITNWSSIGLNHITNSLEENYFNGISLKLYLKKKTTRKYPGMVKENGLLYIDDMLVE